ncbi:unnamed protein product, partial [Mesorhabditis spiculigera]
MFLWMPGNGTTEGPGLDWTRDRVTLLAKAGQTAQLRWNNGNQSYVGNSRHRCSLRIDTCASCLLRIDYTPPASFLSFLQIGLYSSCLSSDDCLEMRFIEDRADWMLDSPYRVHNVLSAPTNSYLSTGPSALFPVNITVIDSTETILGSARAPETTTGYIQSPRYPSAYPSTLEKTWLLQNTNPSGYVRLIFDDFQIHFHSQLTIEESNGELLTDTRQNPRRPAALVSSGPALKIVFHANDFTKLVGFRARYEFVEQREWAEKPSAIDCDDTVEGYGGRIGLENRLPSGRTFVDCVWVVTRTGRTSFDRIFLKVTEFSVPGIGLQLELREGASSIGERLLFLNGHQPRELLAQRQPRHGYTTSLSQPAFYLRLRGYLVEPSGLQIDFSQFYRWASQVCPMTAEWHCDNNRCIKASLRCDGVDNCGDASDEECDFELGGAGGRNDDSHNMFLFAASACALLILLLVGTGFASRVFRQRLRPRQQQSVATIASADSADSSNSSSMAPVMAVVGQRRFYVAPLGELTVVEAPPTYDDALKHPQVPTGNYPRPPNAYTNQAFLESEEIPGTSASAANDSQDVVEAEDQAGPSKPEIGEDERSIASSLKASLAEEPQSNSAAPSKEAEDADEEEGSWV